MTPQSQKMLIGAVVAAALAIAVYYGLITQQTASTIQNTTNQSLGTAPVNQQPAPPTPPTGQAPPEQAAPNPAPPPHQ